MKTILKVAVVMGIIALAAAVTVATGGNVFAGFAAASLATFAVERFTSFTILPDDVAMCSPLIGVKRKCQAPTMGGAKRLYIVLCEDLQNEFLNYDLAKTSGEYSGIIPLVTGKKFVEVEAWYDTTKFDTEMKTGGGFTQSIEFKVLGYDKDLVKFMTSLYETPVNLIVQGNDDRLYWIGQKYVPMMLEAKGVMPEKGTSRKEITFTAKQDGLQIPIMPLATTVTFDVTPLAA